MPSTTSYVAAFALCGVAAMANGAADLLAGTTGIGTYLTIVAGVLFIGSTVAALRGDERTTVAPDSRFARVVAIGGALLYTVGTVATLLT